MNEHFEKLKNQVRVFIIAHDNMAAPLCTKYDLMNHFINVEEDYSQSLKRYGNTFVSSEMS